MRLRRKAIDAYNAAIKNCGNDAEKTAVKALDAWSKAKPDATIAETRNFCIQLLNETASIYGNKAGDAAYAMRSLIADAAGVELPDVDYVYEPEAEYVEQVPCYQVEKLKKGDVDAFKRAISQAARYFAERGANDTMTALGKADAKKLGKKVRFARVPTGATTCPYCCMLASRGFVYSSELTALNANHRHCDCRIVEGFEGMTVEGYDPDEYYDRWQHPEKYQPAPANHPGSTMPQWASDLNVNISERDIGLPSGQRGTVLSIERCDVYTTDDGIELIFPQGLDAAKQDMTPQRAVELLNEVPSEIRANMQRQIFFVDYENPQDPYWRRVYRNFRRSYATGGDEITFYQWTGHDDDYVKRTYCHEAGHYIDKQNGDVSSSQQWQDARTADVQTSGHSSPTSYGNNSDAEDFAESVAEWATNRATFDLEYPQRAGILANLIT